MHKSSPELTIILPTFERPDSLREALESLARQTFQNFVVCIYDNANHKQTKEIAREFGSDQLNIKYCAHKKNIGSEKNFDFGLRRVETEFFVFLSDDDVLLPKCFEHLMCILKQNPDVAFALGKTLRKEAGGEIFSSYGSESSGKLYPKQTIGPDLFSFNFPAWTGGIFRSEILKSVGYFDTTIFAIDFDFLLRINAKYSCIVSDKPCSVFLHNHSGASFLPPGEQFFAFFERLFMKLRTGQIDYPGLEKVILKHISRVYASKSIVALEMRRIERLKSYVGVKNRLVPLRIAYVEFFIFRFIGWVSCHFTFIGRLLGGLLRVRRRLKQRSSAKGVYPTTTLQQIK